jgi:polyisoprenoid-binding protein YceI
MWGGAAAASVPAMHTTPQLHEPLTGTSWHLDPAASRAEFHVRTFWGLATVRGRFGRLAGAMDLDPAGRRRLELTLDAASLDTGNRRRDTHLRSADFFDAERHPEVRFRSTRVSEAGDGRLRVEGWLEAAGRRVELALEPSVTEDGDRLAVHAETTVDQRLLGMTYSRLGIRSPARLAVHAALRRPD